MASTSKLVKVAPAMEPELKAFIDEVLVAILVRDALNDLAAEKILAPRLPAVAHSLAVTALEEIRP